MNLYKLKSGVLSVAGLLLAGTVAAAGQVPAFPGAEGFGAFTQGGRGGKVVFVTNLDDYIPGLEQRIPGSLRAACDMKGPRIVIFKVSGNISLRGTLDITKPYITLAGQTAPGDGICIKNYAVSIRTHDVIVRYMRFRPGDEKKIELDALSLTDAQNVIIDHCSTSWGNDEVLSVTQNSKNVTVQWCIISESMVHSYHSEKSHGYGSLIWSWDGGITFHHNLYAHHDTASPQPGGYPGAKGALIDFRNNVIYNWGKRAGVTNNNRVRINYVGNYLKPGPSTKDGKFAFTIDGEKPQLFAADNVMAGLPNASKNNWRMIRAKDKSNRVTKPFNAPAVKTEPAAEALRSVLTNCGAILPHRDSVDTRVVKNVRAGTGKLIDSQKQVGGWPKLETQTPQTDTDNDGMPDAWETLHGTNPAKPDNNGDIDGDGYTNIEEYLNSTDPTVADR